jgi:transcriptional regulator with XRE-family HTH domain
MGERLQQLRHAKGLSQTQLAAAAGVPVGSLRNWEQGHRTPLLDAAARLAKALGISLDVLAGLEESEAEPPAEKPATKKGTRKRKEK